MKPRPSWAGIRTGLPTGLLAALPAATWAGAGETPLETLLRATGFGRTFGFALGCSLLVGLARMLITADRRRATARRRSRLAVTRQVGATTSAVETHPAGPGPVGGGRHRRGRH